MFEFGYYRNDKNIDKEMFGGLIGLISSSSFSSLMIAAIILFIPYLREYPNHSFFAEWRTVI